MKKYTLILLVILLVTAVTIVPVFATTGGVAASEVAGIAGQTVDMSICVYGYSDVESLAIEYTVPEGLTLESAQWLLDGSVQDIDLDRKRAVWTTDEAIDMTESTAVFQMTFLVGELTVGQLDLEKEVALKVMVDSVQNGRATYEAEGIVSISAPARDIVLNYEQLELDLNGVNTETLIGTVSPAYSTDSLRWESDCEDVVTVDENGLVTAVGVGTANITVTAGNASAVCQVKVTCSHSGGNATCTEKAVCTLCGESYGELDAEDHTGEAKWIQHTDTHSQVYDCCGAEKVAEEAHTWEHGACLVCGATCIHSGGSATCNTQAICEHCGESYGALNAENHTAEAQWHQSAKQHSKIYDCCDAVLVPEEDHNWEQGGCTDCGYTCSHTGGEATCTDKAVCEICGESYGEYNLENHTVEAGWIQNTEKHSMIYACCGAVVVPEGAHTWEDGVCNVCNFACSHTGGEATCTDKALCVICGEGYGELDKENHTAEAVWSQTAQMHSKAYTCCSAVVVEEGQHSWDNGVCTTCGYSCGHIGGSATCTEKAACSICGESYGELNGENHTGTMEWIQTATKHSKVYTCCGAVALEEEKHTWEDGVCSVCEYTCSHSGGEATCKERAVCEHCGESYGSLNSENHAGDIQWNRDAQKHSSIYTCCGAVAVAEGEHIWDNGACSICGYGCYHTGGEATCTDKAICEKCGESYGSLNSENHAGVVEWTQTVFEHGKAYACCGEVVMKNEKHTWANGICSVCEYACIHDEEIELLGHVVENCYLPGYTGDWHCLVCDEIWEKGEEIPASGKHVATDAWLCDETGHWHGCATQGCTAKVDLVGHDYQWKVDKEPTELETGLKHEECMTCQFRKEAVEIPVLTHVHHGVTYHEAIPATCDKTGTVAYWTCESELCAGQYYADEKCLVHLDSIVAPIDPANHIGETYCKDAFEPTCGKDGYTGDTYCADCDAKIMAGTVIEATDEHKPGQEYAADENQHWWTCEVCGAALATENHEMSWVIDQQPTEDVEGKKHQLCAICGYIGSEGTPIERIEHLPVLVEGKKNTCTEDGIADHFYCENCGRYFAVENGAVGTQITEADLVLKATGHQYELNWNSDANGHWQTCHCGEKAETEAHIPTLVGAQEATKEHAGYTGDTVCSVCSYELAKGQAIPSRQEVVVDAVQNAQPGSTVEIGVKNDDGTVDAQILGKVLEAAKGKDVKLVLDMGTYQWVISGKQITDSNLQDVDMKVALDTQNIPADLIEKLAGKNTAMELQAASGGELGFCADLTMNVGTQYANISCDLYFYNANKELVLVGSHTITADGKLTAQITSGGDYLLVINDSDMDASDTGMAEMHYILLSAMFASIVVIVVSVKKQKQLF